MAATTDATPAPRTRLIINADDFAFTPAVTAGILEAHAAGSVTSTSMMVHCPGWEDGVRQARATPTLGIMADGSADIDLIRVRTRVDLGYPVPGWWGTELRVAGINTRRVADEAILYTPWFGPRTLTSSAGTEVILSVASPIAPWGEVDGTVIAIRRGAGNTRIRCAASTRSRRLRMEQERAECEEGASDEGHGVRWFARTATTAARWHPRSRVHANEQRPGSPKMWGLGGAGTEHTPP